MFKTGKADPNGVFDLPFNKLCKHFSFESVKVPRVFAALNEGLFHEGPLLSSAA
jgi:hypothetical protein